MNLASVGIMSINQRCENAITTYNARFASTLWMFWTEKLRSSIQRLIRTFRAAYLRKQWPVYFLGSGRSRNVAISFGIPRNLFIPIGEFTNFEVLSHPVIKKGPSGAVLIASRVKASKYIWIIAAQSTPVSGHSPFGTWRRKWVI